MKETWGERGVTRTKRDQSTSTPVITPLAINMTNKFTRNQHRGVDLTFEDLLSLVEMFFIFFMEGTERVTGSWDATSSPRGFETENTKEIAVVVCEDSESTTRVTPCPCDEPPPSFSSR